MTYVRAAARAYDFVTLHEQRTVFRRRDIRRNKRLGETRPAGARLEFCVARKEGSAAGHTTKDAVPMLAQQIAGTGPFRPFAADNRILRGR